MRYGISGVIGVAVACAGVLADTTGPMFPPPGGVDFEIIGVSAGDAGGLTIRLFDHDPDDIAAGLYYGKSSDFAVQCAMDGAVDSSGETLTFEGFSGNAARWGGVSVIYLSDGDGGYIPHTLAVRFTMTMSDPAGVPINLLDPLAVDPGFPPAADAVIEVAGDFVTHWLFEAEWASEWQPINPLFESLQTDPTTNTVSDFVGGYYLVPPCPCDWTDDGNVNSEDFFAFLEDFDTGNADFNGDGSTNSADLFGFLECFSDPGGGGLLISDASPVDIASGTIPVTMQLPSNLLFLFIPVLLATQHTGASPPLGDWVALFDGESLDGWTRRNGTAEYRVEDGAIVGRTTEGSPNSFLCTDRGYSDFELRFEVKVDDRLNSGVQIRSNTRNGARGRVNGPQVEIEASGDRGAEAGYLYGEAAGGWMTPANDRTPHTHFKDGAWNAYRVLAVGPNIKVWINDVPVSDLTHEGKYRSHPRGFIGLQVHGIGAGAGPFEVRWRDIRLREVRDAEAGWTQLYNGKDLTGWTTTGNWLVEDDGVIAIRPREGERGWQRYGAYLWSERQYGDFILDLEYSYPPGSNSGVYFRVGDRDAPVNQGIECQILDSSEKVGEMTHHDHGGIISTVGASKNMSRAPGEWNRMIVTARGNHLTVDLNGRNIVEIQLNGTPVKDRPARGYIGLQDHGQPNDLRFRSIWIKEL